MTRVALFAGYAPEFARMWAAAIQAFGQTVVIHEVERPSPQAAPTPLAFLFERPSGVDLEYQVVVRGGRPERLVGPALRRTNAARIEASLSYIERLRGRIDLIHGQFYSSVTNAAYTRWPVVLTENSNVFIRASLAGGMNRANKRSIKVAREVYRQADATIAISAQHRSRILEHIPFANPELIHYPVAVPPHDDIVATSGEHWPTAGPDARRLIVIGRLERTKQPDVLLRVLSEMRQELPPFVVDLVGSGSLQSELGALAEELGLGDAVNVRGRVAEDLKWSLLRSADVLVTASAVEGFGLPNVEALLCGTPICSTPVGFAPEMEHLDSTVIAQDVTKSALASALVQALEPPVRAVTQSDRSWLDSTVGVAAVSEKLHTLYGRIL